MTCHFCETTDLAILERNDYLYAIRDKFPVTELHTLLIPFRHVESYFDLDNTEIDAFNELLLSQKKTLLEQDKNISGFNVGFNSGEDAGQTVMHCHIHLIPRRHGDMENPRGGVRGVIPERRDYLNA
jgi:diadenosine tetraphosphate (Ap4A) HIT family hydrolase